MRQETIELRKLTADTGMVLTNGQAYGTEVYLGVGDSSANWYEITAEEYAALREAEETEFM